MVSLPAFPARATPGRGSRRGRIQAALARGGPEPVRAVAAPVALRRAHREAGRVERREAPLGAGAGPRGGALAPRPVRRGRDTPRAGDVRATVGAAVLDLDLLLADRVAHRLGAGLDVLADADLLDHPRFLVDDRLLAAFAGLDHLLLEHGVTRFDRAVDRPALDLDPLLAQVHLLLDRALDDVAADPHRAAADLARADPELLLGPLHHPALGHVAGGRGAGQPEAGRGRARRDSPGRGGAGRVSVGRRAGAVPLLGVVLALEAGRPRGVARRARHALAPPGVGRAGAEVGGRAHAGRAGRRAVPRPGGRPPRPP